MCLKEGQQLIITEEQLRCITDTSFVSITYMLKHKFEFERNAKILVSNKDKILETKDIEKLLKEIFGVNFDINGNITINSKYYNEKFLDFMNMLVNLKKVSFESPGESEESANRKKSTTFCKFLEPFCMPVKTIDLRNTLLCFEDNYCVKPFGNKSFCHSDIFIIIDDNFFTNKQFELFHKFLSTYAYSSHVNIEFYVG
ncbi:MAG: hypothetical protein RsTaC01_0270 [Candidatus Paraimprobicoccus trichonymphae]|uniref:Uncharacterized protein n=1 Tax=Candidatus Paraimprobicoccus trichonymphae TaxID=3033793 RepID=A0AA48HW81_9FIRM|nr:MAG: hypothetical protein RsTaC01_0270 [Candidatus Paraimprobicoccus trichonymphae]